MTPEKWQIADTHQATGRWVRMRTIEFTHTGNNEGTQTNEIQVLERDGTIVLVKQKKIEWEYWGKIKAALSDDGLSLIITAWDGKTGPDGRRREHTLPELG